ncbi:PREDICTED: uncharacterized protein LOC105359821 [Ceratosolen solmsi marchali]|uniref:Uncharacterized protein LOC105359821 n=1 Tax=Ceratosolen solmsi marchali TaxID=326594 RepID=A0AAJ6VKC5_9HYME|nr:PREDICTED: uncharacterized protein LOC105359821 [Ceratosolen solmsi marchali]
MLAVDRPDEKETSSTSCQRRSLRARKPANVNLEILTRRCTLRPKKRVFSEMHNEDQIREYYLDKTVKKYANSLETIFEEKDDMSQTTTYMSAKRFKRMIQFTPEPTDSKLKKRRDKVKKVFGSKVNYRKRRKISIQALLDKLNGLHNDLPANCPKEIKQKAELL